GVDGQVDAEALAAAFGEQRRQHVAIIVLGQALLDKTHAVLLTQRFAALVLRIEHGDARLVVLKMPLDQRQRAFADGAEPDHHDGAGDTAINGMVRHGTSLRNGSSYPPKLTDGIPAARKNPRSLRDWMRVKPPAAAERRRPPTAACGSGWQERGRCRGRLQAHRS